MDLRTVMLMLAFGSFLFGLFLVLLKFRKNGFQGLPYWIVAKFFQAIGSFLLFLRTEKYDTITMLAHTILLLGCAYETWVVGILSGHKVKRWLHLVVSAALILTSLPTLYLSMPCRNGVVFLLHCIFYFMPSIFLFLKSDFKSYLKPILSVCYLITGIVFFMTSFVSFVFPDYVSSEAGKSLFGIIPSISFLIFLTSCFLLLMLVKERSDMLVKEMQKSLEKSEIRFQKIVETSIAGILIFDENYRITFSNENMASMLGYSAQEMLGKSYISFFTADQLDVYYEQEALRKKGEDSVYECCLLRKDGKCRWFLISAKALVDEDGKFEGSFAMLTDINDRKEMEMLLEEANRRLEDLSNKDGLTGIANRRRFDEVLELEYNRLSRSKSKLSIIMFDIDKFKEYNDYYGHVLGDECLRQMGQVLSDCISRSVDLAARYGGEEFACILPDTELSSAVRIAERIQQRIRGIRIEHKKSSVSDYVTASFGVITVKYSPELSPNEIIAMVDQLLYKAKASGRNRIESAEWNGAELIYQNK